MAGVILGTLAAAGATWLYKTPEGKKFRLKFRHQYNFAKRELNEVVAEIKHQAEELERAEGSQETIEKLKAAKKRLSHKATAAVKKIKKNVFLKSGRPLLK